MIKVINMPKLFNVHKIYMILPKPISMINRTKTSTSHMASPPSKSWEEIPGPWSLPIIGQLHHFLPGGSLYNLEGYNLQNHLYKTYGPIVKLKGFFGGPDIVLLFDAESAAQILRAENLMPKRPGFFSLEYYKSVYKKQNGNRHKFGGLITDHGETWRELRNLVNPIMLQPKCIKLYHTQLDEVAQEMVTRMKFLRDPNNMIKSNIGEEFNLWTVESVGLVALGTRLRSFDLNVPSNPKVRELIKIERDFFTVADKLDFKPSIWRYYPIKTFKRAMQIYEDLEKLNSSFINEAIEKLKTKENPRKEKTILEKLVEIDERVAVIIASDVIFAGIDTVRNAMIFLLYLLAKNPDKQKKLREELRTKSDRRPYIKACIKESMRIMPIVFGNLRETSKEYNLMSYKIPKQKCIMSCHEYMCLMECHYPRPHEYIPERWLVDKDDPMYHGNAHPFAFSIFGYGSRGCIGRRVAELVIELFLVRIIENFQVKWFGEPLKVRQSIVTYAVEPFNFIFEDV